MTKFKTRQEKIKILVDAGITGLDKPWEKMTMDEKAIYAMCIDHKRAKDVDVPKIKSVNHRAEFIGQFPRAANRYDINALDDTELSIYVISAAPSLIKKLPKDRIKNLRWGCILPDQPQLAKYCDFSKLSAIDWVRILPRQPQFIDRFDPSRFTEAREWRTLVLLVPSLWRKCPFDSFSHDDKILVASASMNLLKKLDVNSFTCKDWQGILECNDSDTEPVKVWLATELKRLSGKLKLPRA